MPYAALGLRQGGVLVVSGSVRQVRGMIMAVSTQQETVWL